jgi:hypothetical protein
VERVSFLVEATGERLPCMLNPETLAVRRVAGVRPRRTAAGALTGAEMSDDPLLHTGGGRTELDLDLLFDVSLAGGNVVSEDVRDLTRPLWNLAENGTGGTAPQVRFVWGKTWNVPGVVVSVSERLENFTPQGVGRRSWLRMRLWRVAEAARQRTADPLRVDPGPALDAAALASVPPDAFSIRELGGGLSPGGGERLDTFLARNDISPAHWKLIASLNGIDDPHHVSPATALRLPPPGLLGGTSR